MHISIFFFFNDTATTEIYTLSLHDALPICPRWAAVAGVNSRRLRCRFLGQGSGQYTCTRPTERSEEHTSELQSRLHLVCRLLLEKKKKNTHTVSRDHSAIPHCICGRDAYGR